MLKKQHIMVYLLLIAMAIAIYTQFPDADKGIVSYANYAAWLLLFGLMVAKDRVIYFSQCMKSLTLIAVGGYAFYKLLVTLGVLDSLPGYVGLVRIPMIVYYAAYCISRFEKDGTVVKLMMLVFSVMTMIMAIQIASQFVTNFSVWQSAQMYLYRGSTHKNSTAQVIGAGFIVILIGIESKRLWQKVIKVTCLVIMLAALLYVQSRAALIAIGIALIFSALLQGDKKKVFQWSAVLVVGIIIMLNSEALINLMSRVFFIEKYSSRGSLDLNRFSSGRLEFWKECWDYFLQSPLWGKGYTYCDNFYINALASGGILFGGMLLGVYFFRVSSNLSMFKKSVKANHIDKIAQMTAIISIFYLIISIFEGFPPYGPGVASMSLWLFSGYLDGRKKFCPNMSMEASVNE